MVSPSQESRLTVPSTSPLQLSNPRECISVSAMCKVELTSQSPVLYPDKAACRSVGYPQYELVEGGSELIVDSHNVGDYIDAVVNATLHEGIAAQMQGFRCATDAPASHGTRRKVVLQSWQCHGFATHDVASASRDKLQCSDHSRVSCSMRNSRHAVLRSVLCMQGGLQ